MIILDASVILKWFKPEADSERALVFADKHSAGEELIGVPDFLRYEVANVLRYGKNISEQNADEALDILARMEIQTFTFSILELKDVLIFSRKFDITVYDGLYVVLASRLQCRLITADKVLYERTKQLGSVYLLAEA